MSLPLQGVKVLELEGLAPTVFAGQILADLGAEVTIVCKPESTNPLQEPIEKSILNRGKKCITIDFKNQQEVNIFKALIKSTDVLIDSMRPGILEKLNLGPQICLEINPKLVFARISSFGQNSKLSQLAGHDINFLSYSGVLSMLASTGNDPNKEQPPAIPGNLLGDFAAGSCLGVVGILAALFHIRQGGVGQVVDLGMAQASIYLSSFILSAKANGYWNKPRGQNLLDGGAHFYNIYRCKDNKYISVGCIEAKFYSIWINIMRANTQEHYLEFLNELESSQFNLQKWSEYKTKLQEIYIQKNRDEWMNLFQNSDACVAPVYEIIELKEVGNRNLGYQDRKLIIDRDKENTFAFEIAPQPIFSKCPTSQNKGEMPKKGQHNQQLKPKL